MRLYLKLIVFVLLVSGTTLVEAAQSKRHTVGSTRSLRVAKSTDNEERGIQDLTKALKTTFWLETGKSDDYVRNVLGLKNLSGDKLKTAPNYVYYEHFLHALEGRKLQSWLAKGKTTKSVWAEYKLDDIRAAQLKDNDGFKTYLRYAIMEDNHFYKQRIMEQPVKVDYSGTPAELSAKVDMWFTLNRPTWYVKKMLNLDRRSINTFLKSPNYLHYERFEMKTWMAKKYSTNAFWKDHKLNTVPVKQLESKRIYRKFVRYATMVDDESFQLYKSGQQFEKLKAGESEAEIKTKVAIWASKDRPFKYVQDMLGINGARDTLNANYKYFEDFVKRTNILKE
ncbi:hypothetical protein F442_00460 [Phytophthora nicotianae P10297]|uniref:RxLR effector protein n=4 Tax=Phytophthora nicotianae TaxID=4792 RepID=W3A6Q6_PHYNI|nr:hypothetical protein L917_00419 [Phytophthora nicotianae]ETM56632.1 hypothetical protein L914_00439 [Phytophthora nicotianae]ETP54915.1 hypothetical protein F442_00460 [Phytophthora nicotianae P10297]